MSKKKSSKKAPPPKKKSLILRIFKGLFVLGLWAALGLGLLGAWYARELPELVRNPNVQLHASITFKAADGSIIARYGELRGDNIDVGELPPFLIYAVLAVEDRRFYEHHGIDPLGIARAVVTNLTSRRVAQGGSTITQQLAKNLFLSRERTLKRKIQEAILALWLEHEMTKDQIMTAYLNRVYLGSGAYGVEAAAQTYFNKSARDLSLRESATLAGLLKAPSRYSPLSNPELARERADVVLASMRDAGYITEEEEKKNLRTKAILPPAKPSGANTSRYYTDWVAEQLEDMIGTPQTDLIVETTLSPDIQTAAAKSLTEGLRGPGKEKNASQGAAIVMRHDGALLAMIGGRDYNASQFNRATQALRQPGSSFKPIVYLTALENGWRPDDVIEDKPLTEGKYRPENYGGEYYGPVTIETALTLSLNTVAVRLMQNVGPGRVIGMARRLGITADLGRNESLALGSSGVPMIEMATAYTIIARDGMAVVPYAITRISDKDGNVYYQRGGPPPADRVVDPRLTGALTDMMVQVIDRGTGRAAMLPFPAAGKTGTTQDFRDAWFIGFTGEYTAAVWMGNDDYAPMKRMTGGALPALVWRDIMLAAHRARTLAPSENPPENGTDSFQSLLGRVLGGSLSDQKIEPRPDGAFYRFNN